MEDPHYHGGSESRGLVPVKKEQGDIFPHLVPTEKYLAQAGFTPKLPELVRDLNNVLGANQGEPNEVRYTIGTNQSSPQLAVAERYSFGVPIILRTFRGDDSSRRYPRLEIGNVPPDRSMRSLVLQNDLSMLLSLSDIASVGLSDLQQFVKKTFPKTRMIFYKPEWPPSGRANAPVFKNVKRENKVVESLPLTEERLNNLPSADPPFSRPYLVIPKAWEKIYGNTEYSYSDFSGYDPFLIMGFNPESKHFALRCLIFDTRKHGGTGRDIERVMSSFHKLYLKIREERPTGMS